MSIKPTPYVIGIGETDFNSKGEAAGMNEMMDKPISRDKIHSYLRKLKLTAK